MNSKRVQALVLATAAVAGYTGAAAWSASALPSVAVATDFGPDDGLLRYVVSAEGGVATPSLLAGLEDVEGVVTAQRLTDGRALVATDALTPRDLARVTGVAAVEVSPSVPVLGTISDPYFPQYGWNLENTGRNAYQQTPVADADVDATLGWESGTGAGRVVAVVDTGFDSDHPDLAGSLWTNPAENCGAVDTDGNGKAGDCHGWNFLTNSADVDNGNLGTHGASVSGVVGARADNGHGSAGVAPGVQIMPLVIGGGSSVDVNLGAEAIRYAVDHGADVINASWGGGFTGSALTNLRSAVAYAAAHDVLIVAAAGNDAGNRDTSILYPASLTDPNVITVGNSDAADRMSASSAYGATSVDLFAPGNLVATTWNDGGYRLVSGTSIAAPHVAAAVALYRAALPAAGAAEVKQALLEDVDPVPALAGRSVTGGRLTLGGLAASGGEAVRYAFTGMTAPAGVVAPAIGISGPSQAGDYAVAIGLGMEAAGEIWALSGEAVTLDGVTVPTGDSGDAMFPLGTGPLNDVGLSPSVELGDGRYVLTVQLFRDGSPVGRMHAAPLLVGTAAEGAPGDAPGEGTDGEGPDGADSDGDSPGSDTGTAPDGSGGGSAPGDGSDSGSGPGNSPDHSPGPDVPDGSGPDIPDGISPDVPDGISPDVPDGASPDAPDGSGADAPDDAGTPPGGSDGGAPDDAPDGGTGPGEGLPGPGDGSGGDVPPPADGGDGPDVGDPDDTTTYPEVGAFRITSLRPDTVSTAGGTLVTITGGALPSDPVVRIGATVQADVIAASATAVVFRAPAREAGVYDVSVFAPDRTSSVLPDALTYTSGGGPGGSGPDDGVGTGPDDGVDEGPGTGPEPTPGDGTDGGTGGPVVRSGPAGERLVRSARFSALISIWTVDCSSSCTGVAI